MNAEMRFTLSGDSSLSYESSRYSEDNQLKVVEVPEYIKEIASRGKQKFYTNYSFIVK